MFVAASRLPPSHLFPFDSRGLWIKRGHTRARHRYREPSTLVSPCTNPFLPCFSFSSSSSTFSLFQHSLNFAPTEFHAPLRKAWDHAKSVLDCQFCAMAAVTPVPSAPAFFPGTAALLAQSPAITAAATTLADAPATDRPGCGIPIFYCSLVVRGSRHCNHASCAFAHCARAVRRSLLPPPTVCGLYYKFHRL